MSINHYELYQMVVEWEEARKDRLTNGGTRITQECLQVMKLFFLRELRIDSPECPNLWCHKRDDKATKVDGELTEELE